jgi:hypothetical protein
LLANAGKPGKLMSTAVTALPAKSAVSVPEKAQLLPQLCPEVPEAVPETSSVVRVSALAAPASNAKIMLGIAKRRKDEQKSFFIASILQMFYPITSSA